MTNNGLISFDLLKTRNLYYCLPRSSLSRTIIKTNLLTVWSGCNLTDSLTHLSIPQHLFLLTLLWLLGDVTHIVKVDHESNVASDGGAEVSLTGGQPQASGCSGTTRLPLGRVRVPSSLLTVVGQNLTIPLKQNRPRQALC